MRADSTPVDGRGKLPLNPALEVFHLRNVTYTWPFPEQVDLTNQDVKLLWPKTLGSSPAYHDGEGALCHRGLVEQSKGPPAHPVPVQPQRSTPSPELGRKCVCLCCSKKGGSESYRVVALHPCWSASWLVSWRLLLRPCTHGSLSTRVFSVLVLLPWTQNPLPDHAPHRNNVSNSRKPLQNRKAQLQRVPALLPVVWRLVRGHDGCWDTWLLLQKTGTTCRGW